MLSNCVQAALAQVLLLFLTLKEMEEKNIKIDSVAYNTTIDAWANLGKPEKVEEIIAHMDGLYKAGQLKKSADSLSYGGLLKSWQMSGRPRVSEKLEAILNDVESKASPGDRSLTQNTVHYTSKF